MTDHEAFARLVSGTALPSAFERWQVVLAPAAERATDAAEWAGALVLVAEGTVQVECRAGGQHTFTEGDLVALGWLPLRTLRNPGRVPARLVAVRRRGHQPTASFLHVRRAEPTTADPSERSDGL